MKFVVFWQGEKIPFSKGDSISTALNRAGIVYFGAKKVGGSRAVFCGVGQCQNCQVWERSIGEIEACLLLCEPGMELSPIDQESTRHNEI